MADNIRIIGDINETERVSRFDSKDILLLNLSDITQYFGYENDYIEFFIYDESDVILELNYNYKNFKLPNDSYIVPGTTLPLIEIDPIKDLQRSGYSSGTYKAQYNFFKKKISDFNRALFISEISDDRTELKINSTSISSTELVAYGQQLIDELNSSPYQKYYLLNFQSNFQQVAINIAIDNTGDIPSLLFKLYQPLLDNISLKDTLSLVEEIIEPFIFTINLDTIVEPAPLPKLRGPNFSIDVDSKQNLPSGYETYDSLISSLTGSSYQKVLNYMKNKSYDLNVDYTLFDNFIHFSSAKKRLEIFKHKLEILEGYNTNISNVLSSTSALKYLETASIKNKIDDVVSNFDGFEHYLYFESGSYAFPKTNGNRPYINKFINKKFYQTSPSSTWTFNHNLNEIPQVVSVYSSSGDLLPTQSSTVGINNISLTFSSVPDGYVTLTSPNALTWYNEYTSSAANYDENNLDHLYGALPNYIRDDSDGYQSYFNFIDMIGHYFDNIWIYITSINELYNADNNLEKGISKDIVYDALRSLGVKLYNSKGDNQFDDYITGLNSGSIIFNDNFSSTSSFLNNVPKKDLLSELYKRIYHNTILLNKNKGTSEGLQNLITTFGVTSSIFSPKEFGGTAKNNQLKGYNNDKITIHNNNITGSVLSPFISLQLPNTSSVQSTSTDLHFVDLSFSPQTQLDLRISSSIALTSPTFSLDDYIGDPRLMSSSSYESLIEQQYYFTSASAAISGSAQRLDYKGFTELVKYFDNSLFKMLKDFVPARTNTLTGITIKSPVLERNKIKINHPKVTEETVYEANYMVPILSEDKDYHYDILPGNKSQFYTGELSGSYANINDIFENSNPNPYLQPTESINLNNFNHSDFNVTLNNISSSIVSNSKFKVEKIYTLLGNKVFQPTSSIEYITNAELQDSYDTLLGHQRSRYDGSKLSSIVYNNYTSASANYSGDVSYGKTAAIDHNTGKIGIFTQINDTNNLFDIPLRSSVSLKYLVDVDGNLTELNKKNKRWHEIQNTFKAGQTATIALFDNQKYSDQKKTDGIKLIYSSGYSYFPMIYAASSADDKLFFNYTGDSISKIFKINTVGGFIIGSPTLTYPLVGEKGYKLFNKTNDPNSPGPDSPNASNSEGNAYYSNNGVNTFSTYSIQETGKQRFNAKFDINVTFNEANQSGSFTFKINKVGTATPLRELSIAVTSSYKTTQYTDLLFASITGTTFILPSPTKVYNTSGTFVKELNQGTLLYKIIPYQYVDECYGQGSFARGLYVEQSYFNSVAASPHYDSFGQSCSNMYVLPSFDRFLYELPENNLSNTLSFDVLTPEQPFTLNDKITFEFSAGGSAGNFSTPNYTASISSGGVFFNQLSTNQVGSYPYVESIPTPFISGSIGINTIAFSSELSSLKDYQFVPSGSGISFNDQNSLWNKYGDIDYTFSPSVGDIMFIYYGGTGNFFESNITAVTSSNGNLLLSLSPDLPSGLRLTSYVNTPTPTVDKFLILKKVNDETNVVLTFHKPDNPTSLGFLIPENIHPDVLNNIDVITKEIKQKLIDQGSLTSGGSF
jgi:hypothetical protein